MPRKSPKKKSSRRPSRKVRAGRAKLRRLMRHTPVWEQPPLAPSLVLQDAGIDPDPPEFTTGGLAADAPLPRTKPNSPGTDHILAGKPYLPTDPAERKGYPIVTGFLDYFPLACLEVSAVSVAGNKQHNPGEPLHWARDKSSDQADTAVRHVMERGAKDTDGQYHMAKAIWRMMADFEIFLEEQRGLPPSRASWV